MDEEADFGHIGVEEQEDCECSAADGISFGECLCCIAGSVELVHPLADGFGCLAHLNDTACIVSDGAKGVHGKHVGTDHEHTDGCSCSSVETAELDAALGTEPEGEE